MAASATSSDALLTGFPQDVAWVPPAISCIVENKGGAPSLTVEPPKGDFWRKTFYAPVLDVFNGCRCSLLDTAEEEFMAEVHFQIHGKDGGSTQQFDQAGFFVYVDDEHWIKAGLECVDGQPYVSSVTTNTHSDWSTIAHSKLDLWLRIHRVGPDFVMEFKTEAGEWKFYRISHLQRAEGKIQFGLFAFAPTATGMKATFDSLSVKQGKHFHHTAD